MTPILTVFATIGVVGCGLFLTFLPLSTCLMVGMLTGVVAALCGARLSHKRWGIEGVYLSRRALADLQLRYDQVFWQAPQYAWWCPVISVRPRPSNIADECLRALMPPAAVSWCTAVIFGGTSLTSLVMMRPLNPFQWSSSIGDLSGPELLIAGVSALIAAGSLVYLIRQVCFRLSDRYMNACRTFGNNALMEWNRKKCPRDETSSSYAIGHHHSPSLTGPIASSNQRSRMHGAQPAWEERLLVLRRRFGGVDPMLLIFPQTNPAEVNWLDERLLLKASRLRAVIQERVR